VADEVFLSYVRENTDLAERLAADLEAAGVKVWLDRKRLAPGDRWPDAIRNAIRNGHLFIACFSREFAARDASHMNEELTLAIEELRRRPTDRTWFIPVVIDDSEVPNRDIGAGASLRALQWVDLSTNWAEGVGSIVKVALRDHPSGSSTKPSKRARVSKALRTRNNPDRTKSAVPITDLQISYSLQRGSTYWHNVSHDEIRVLLTITNHGSSAASASYIRLQVPLGFSIGPLGVASRDSGAPLQIVSEAVQPPASSFIARTDFLLHTSVPVQFAQVTNTIKGNVPVPSCEIHYRAAANGVSGEGTLIISAEEIARVIERPVEPRER
jgi:hypothetical protein